VALLNGWVSRAAHSKLAPFVKLARTIRRYKPLISNTAGHGLSNAPVESVNTKIRLLHRIAFGYRNPEALIAMATLDLGGRSPKLPGRAPA
jgi:transposase